MKPILEVKHITKQFKIGVQQERYLSLRDVIANPFKKKNNNAKSFLALNDISFDVYPGESIGIIGRNGAGKSTLLKILSRITPPTSGKIISRGRIASLLEVGTGFHPELSGRENIYMNGSILGMRKAEINKHFDAIVQFSGVGKFLDTPLKRYSSGMQLRLAFSVAAHLEPEILVIDEVLAVGDAEFQKKCLGKMDEVSKSGRTVIFVSHDMGAIQTLCAKSILLQGGNISMIGPSSQVIDHYLKHNRSGYYWEQEEINSKPHFKSIGAEIVGEQPSLILRMSVKIKNEMHMDPSFIAFDISNNRGTVIAQAIPSITPFINISNGEKSYSIDILINGFVPGDYLVSAWMGPHNSYTYDIQNEIIGFSIVDSPQPGRVFPHTSDHGNLILQSVIQDTGISAIA